MALEFFVVIEQVNRSRGLKHGLHKAEVQINFGEEVKTFRLEQVVTEIKKDVRVVLDQPVLIVDLAEVLIEEAPMKVLEKKE